MTLASLRRLGKIAVLRHSLFSVHKIWDDVQRTTYRLNCTTFNLVHMSDLVQYRGCHEQRESTQSDLSRSFHCCLLCVWMWLPSFASSEKELLCCSEVHEWQKTCSHALSCCEGSVHTSRYIQTNGSSRKDRRGMKKTIGQVASCRKASHANGEWYYRPGTTNRYR